MLSTVGSACTDKSGSRQHVAASRNAKTTGLTSSGAEIGWMQTHTHTRSEREILLLRSGCVARKLEHTRNAVGLSTTALVEKVAALLSTKERRILENGYLARLLQVLDKAKRLPQLSEEALDPRPSLLNAYDLLLAHTDKKTRKQHDTVVVGKGHFHPSFVRLAQSRRMDPSGTSNDKNIYIVNTSSQILSAPRYRPTGFLGTPKYSGKRVLGGLRSFSP